MNFLVCGGAGYIGSHMLKLLVANGHSVVCFDNLSTGYRDAVKWGGFVEGDLLYPLEIESVLQAYQFDAVIHFAACSLVGESQKNPELYYRNNVIGTLNLLDAMRKYDIKKFVFSSTAAVFGNPQSERIDEMHVKNPINVYGRSKLMVEQVLRDYANAYGIRSVALRYFNAAGADPEGEAGERHEPETHLIPNIIRSLLEKRGSGLKVFGSDYNTLDGTCVRDYIHVHDLCSAHLLAVDYLNQKEGAFSFNLGNGDGFSVLQVINAVEEVTGQEVAFEMLERRAGDPAILVADASFARKELGWIPEITEMNHIIQTAWNWHGKELAK